MDLNADGAGRHHASGGDERNDKQAGKAANQGLCLCSVVQAGREAAEAQHAIARECHNEKRLVHTVGASRAGQIPPSHRRLAHHCRVEEARASTHQIRNHFI